MVSYLNNTNNIEPPSANDNSGPCPVANCYSACSYETRTQPSRESCGVTLNNFMEKYVTKDYRDVDFMDMAALIKNAAKTWNKLPKNVQKEFMKNFNVFCEVDRKNKLNEFKMKKENEKSKMKNAMQRIIGNVNTVKTENFTTNYSKDQMSIIIITAIVCLVVGYLIAFI